MLKWETPAWATQSLCADGGNESFYEIRLDNLTLYWRTMTGIRCFGTFSTVEDAQEEAQRHHDAKISFRQTVKATWEAVKKMELPVFDIPLEDY